MLFSRSNYTKWIAIGRATPHLDLRMREIIPPRLSIAYEFVQLSHDERVRFLDERPVKSPPLQRAEIIRWKKQNRSAPSTEDQSKGAGKPKNAQKADPILPGRFYSALKAKRLLTFIEMEALNKRLEEISRDYSMDVVFRLSRLPRTQP